MCNGESSLSDVCSGGEGIVGDINGGIPSGKKALACCEQLSFSQHVGVSGVAIAPFPKSQTSEGYKELLTALLICVDDDDIGD